MKGLIKIAGVLGLFLIVKFFVFISFTIGSDFFVDKTTIDQVVFNSKLIGYSTFISSIITLLVLYFWRPIRGIVDKWQKLSPFYLALCLILGFLGAALNSFILSFFVDSQQEMMEQSKVLLHSGIIGLFSIAILVPILEEIVFRRILIEILIKEVNPAIAIVISALVFGVLHGQPVQMLGATLLGLLFGWIYYQSKSILPSILIHIINNASFLMVLNYTEGSLEETVDDSYWSVQHPYGWIVFLVTLIVFSVVARVVYQKSRSRS